MKDCLNALWICLPELPRLTLCDISVAYAGKVHSLLLSLTELELIKKFLIKVQFVSLVNLVSFSEVVPELIGGDMNADNVHNRLVPLLSDTIERRMQLEGYAQMKAILGPAGAPDRAAQKIVNLLEVEADQA